MTNKLKRLEGEQKSMDQYAKELEMKVFNCVDTNYIVQIAAAVLGQL
jgi:hypothetical protein